jgi:hypothetical protein
MTVRVYPTRPNALSKQMLDALRARADAKEGKRLRALAAPIGEPQKTLSRPFNPKRVDEMLKRKQITRDQHAAAVQFQCAWHREAALNALGRYSKFVLPILLNDKPAGDLAKGSNRTKAISEVMGKLCSGLDLLAKYYEITQPPLTPKQRDFIERTARARQYCGLHFGAANESKTAIFGTSQPIDLSSGSINPAPPRHFRIVKDGRHLMETFEESFLTKDRYVFILATSKKIAKPLIFIAA